MQTLLGLRSASTTSTLEFYVDGDADSPWVQHAATTRGLRFWVAVDVFGDGTRCLLSTDRAATAPLTRRLPEAHPGLVKRPLFIGIRIAVTDGGVFRVVGASDR